MFKNSNFGLLAILFVFLINTSNCDKVNSSPEPENLASEESVTVLVGTFTESNGIYTSLNRSLVFDSMNAKHGLEKFLLMKIHLKDTTFTLQLKM